jgi:hypothetical protein
LTPSLQLWPCFRRSPCGEERRTGAALIQRAAFSAARGARSSTSDAPCRPPRRPARVRAILAGQNRFCRTPVKEHDFHDPKRLSSTGAPPRSACACCVGTRHRSRGFAAAEPASGDPLRYPGLAPRTAAPPCHPRLITTGSTVQVRRLSTSAITTVLEHDSRFDPNIPWTPHRELPPCSAYFRQLCALRRAAGRADAGSGASERLATPPAFPGRDFSRGSFAPTRSSRTPHVASFASVLAGAPRTDVYGTEVPANPPADDARGAFRTRAASRHPPRRGLRSAHPRCLPSMGKPPEGWRP